MNNNSCVIAKLSLSKLYSGWKKEKPDSDYNEPLENWHLAGCKVYEEGRTVIVFENNDDCENICYRILIGELCSGKFKVRHKLRHCAGRFRVNDFGITDSCLVLIAKYDKTTDIYVCDMGGKWHRMPDFDSYMELSVNVLFTVIGNTLYFISKPEKSCFAAADSFRNYMEEFYRDNKAALKENDYNDEDDDDEEEDDYNDSSNNRKKDIGDISREIAAKVQVLKKPEKDELSAAEKLEKLIGLSDTKAKIREIRAYARMQKRMEALGKKANELCFNMVFTGNPGTAKTTVARLVAGILYEEGIIKEGKFMEVGRSDLVAVYLGQTAVKIKKVFKDIKGGVLFVDEAYSLFENYGDSNGYTDEALGTIVQEMENNRDTVVIFAGYTKEMNTLLNHNPGLRSRFPIHLEFNDYSADELTEIAELEINRKGFGAGADVRERIKSLCEIAMKKENFGNGRFCRLLVEGAEMKHALALADKIETATEKELFTLSSEDFVMPDGMAEQEEEGKMVSIGFCA